MIGLGYIILCFSRWLFYTLNKKRQLSVKFFYFWIVFEFILAYIIPYGIIYLLGMISRTTSYKTDRYISIICLAAFIISAYAIYSSTGMLQPTQFMKYPPTIYYISYALFVSFLLLSLFKRIGLKSNRLIEFCSKSSLWIYLWHILFITIIPIFCGELDWILMYILVVICSIVITYIQNKLIDILAKANLNEDFLKIFR